MIYKFEEEAALKRTKEKFNNLHRRRVVDAIQKHYNVKLKRAGKRHKWLRDESARNWWVLGGTGYWHGIPEDMMADEIQAQSEGMLVIAWQKAKDMEVFSGPLDQLVSARDNLYRASQSTGDYQFEVKVSGACLRCVQASNVVLERFETIPYATEDKERDRRMNEIRKIVATISPKERAILFKKLQGIRNENANG